MKRHDGYIGITTAVIAMAILLSVAIGLSNSNFLGRMDTAQLEFKEMSLSVARGCLEYVRLKLAQGSYAGNETITISNVPCAIQPIVSQGGQHIIKVSVTVERSTTNLRLTVSASTLDTVLLEEVSSF